WWPGAGASGGPRGLGAALCDPAELITDRRSRQLASLSPGTVGAVALDRAGVIAAATSTGGTSGKLPGRVGDSPLIGCGTYAESTLGGVSCTGDGEAIIRVVLARRTLEIMKSVGDPKHACQVAMDVLVEEGRGGGGLIAVDGRGRGGGAPSTRLMRGGWPTPSRGLGVGFGGGPPHERRAGGGGGARRHRSRAGAAGRRHPRDAVRVLPEPQRADGRTRLRQA